VINETETANVSMKDRFLGCLLGLAIGDALGMPVEGWTHERIERTYGRITDYVPRIDDAGNQIVAAGEITDDTELALCHVESLTASGGFVDPETIGMRFLRLYNSDSRKFMGRTTNLALARADETKDFQNGVVGDWPAGNGVASRIAPIGLMHALSRLNAEVFSREVMRAGLVTHSHPESLNGALAVAYAVRLIAAQEVPPEVLIDEVAAFIDEDEVARRLRLARQLSRAGRKRMPDLDNLARIGTSGYVAESVAAALYCFVSYPHDFERAVLTAVNAGGDTDSIGAITGALAGAQAGASGIPPRLVEGLEGRMYLLVAAPGLYRAAQRRAGLFLQLHRRE
jgi:ADP-ribosylglycohydrolase